MYDNLTSLNINWANFVGNTEGKVPAEFADILHEGLSKSKLNTTVHCGYFVNARVKCFFTLPIMVHYGLKEYQYTWMSLWS